MDNYEYIHKETMTDEKFSDNVLAICAINAALRTKGVLGVVGGLTDSLSENLLKKETLSKGCLLYTSPSPRDRG